MPTDISDEIAAERLHPKVTYWCLLVRYPSRQHFLSMMANAAYRDALVHR